MPSRNRRRSGQAVNQIVDTFMKQFPPEAEILQMPTDDLGMHLLKSMMVPTRRRTGSISAR
jgi:hypothetical protein